MSRLLAILSLALALATADSDAQPKQAPPLVIGEMLKGRFIQERHLSGMSAPLRSEGQFLLLPGRGLIWRVERPFATVAVITPVGILQSVNGAEPMRLPAARLPSLARFYDMLAGALTGDWVAMQQNFHVEAHTDGASWTIALTPRDPSDAITTQIATIAVTGSELVESVEIHRPNGDWERLTFHDQTRSAAAPSPDDIRLFESAEH